MRTHAILELEEGALNVVVGGRDGETLCVQRSLRVPMPDLSREGLGNALRQVGSDELQGTAAVHVILGERRTQHFVSRAPRMSPADTVALVVREALRTTNVGVAADVLVATRLLRESGGNRLLGTTALARSVWQPLAAAFAASNLEVLGLYSMEACLAGAAPAGPGPVAILEVNSGRARFVLSEDQCPVQVRRFLIGGGAEGNSSALTTQLAMELPRTLDWLRETGHRLPSTLLLGTRAALEDQERAMLAGDELQAILPAGVEVTVADGQLTPSLSALMLLQRLADGSAMPSLLEPPTLHMPWRKRRWIGLAAIAAAGIVGSLSAFVDGSAWWQKRAQLTSIQQEAQRLETELIVKTGVAATPSEGEAVGDSQLQAALALRRPISRFLGDVSNLADEGVYLDELKFASADHPTVSGFVEGKSRQAALATMATFARRVRSLGYLAADGQDEIVEVAGPHNRFRFRLSLSWRNG